MFEEARVSSEERQQLEAVIRFLDRKIENERAETTDESIAPRGSHSMLDGLIEMRKSCTEKLAGRDYVGRSSRVEMSCPCGWRVSTRPGRTEDLAHIRLLMDEHRKTCNVPETRRFPTPEVWAALEVLEAWHRSSRKSK
jgi:hypothetical protein